MNTKFCTCAYQKCKDYGLNPQNHSPSCPMYEQDNLSPYKEEWLNENDKIRYNEIQKSYGKR